MNLKDIKPEEFVNAIAMVHDEPEKFLYLQTEAVAEVPLIKLLMKVYGHDVESKTPKFSTNASKAALSIVTALYLLEKNAENSDTQS